MKSEIKAPENAVVSNPYEKLFDPKYDSPLYGGLEFNSITSHYVTLNNHI